MYLYVASSWRNPLYPPLLSMLTAWGHKVYDFRLNGFSWENVYPDWNSEQGDCYSSSILEGLDTPTAKEGFDRDINALDSCDALILCLPCGASAHTEFGCAVGRGKPTAVLLPYHEFVRPDLMWKLADLITEETAELMGWLKNQSMRWPTPR